jgi:hypothetical protein
MAYESPTPINDEQAPEPIADEDVADRHPKGAGRRGTGLGDSKRSDGTPDRDRQNAAEQKQANL